VDAAALGAFLSGAAAVISALLSLRMTRKRMKADCDERIEEVKKALREGLELGRR
jgi:hypothetical protein